jgi:hypothetical protein
LGSRSNKPFDIAVTPNGRKLYVLNSGGDTVTILPRNFKQSAFSGEFRSQLTPYARGFHDRDRRETLIGDSVAERGGFEPPRLVQDSMGGIRPEFGTLFGPKKNVQAEEKLFARNSLSSDLSGSLGSLR